MHVASSSCAMYRTAVCCTSLQITTSQTAIAQSYPEHAVA